MIDEAATKWLTALKNELQSDLAEVMRRERKPSIRNMEEAEAWAVDFCTAHMEKSGLKVVEVGFDDKLFIKARPNSPDVPIPAGTIIIFKPVGLTFEDSTD